MSYRLTKTQLLFDLYYAFECAKKHKKSKQYVKFSKAGYMITCFLYVMTYIIGRIRHYLLLVL